METQLWPHLFPCVYKVMEENTGSMIAWIYLPNFWRIQTSMKSSSLIFWISSCATLPCTTHTHTSIHSQEHFSANMWTCWDQNLLIPVLVTMNGLQEQHILISSVKNVLMIILKHCIYHLLLHKSFRERVTFVKC